MRKHASDDTAVGEDSFLDTTANLVGILIILVVIIGVKTRVDAQVYSESLVEQQQETASQIETGQIAAMQDARLKQEMDKKRYDQELAFRKQERSQLMLQVAFAREAIEEKLAEADSAQRESVERQSQIAKLEAEISEVSDQLDTDEPQPRPTVILEHLPTPMAKTVFNREMHIQIQGNVITVIPWDRLVEMLKQQIPLAARRQASRRKLRDTLGPVGGFAMHYEMVSVPGGFELDHFDLEVLASAPRESIEQALSPTGRMQLELASRNPRETVVTAWVYPDSFETFRQLKARLFQSGFLTAARPLPHGQPIGASPKGTRSSAQ
ncbi:MAG: hypothetical protein Aurels2KO_16950 [Aureliella sp.]